MNGAYNVKDSKVTKSSNGQAFCGSYWLDPDYPFWGYWLCRHLNPVVPIKHEHQMLPKPQARVKAGQHGPVWHTGKAVAKLDLISTASVQPFQETGLISNLSYFYPPPQIYSLDIKAAFKTLFVHLQYTHSLQSFSGAQFQLSQPSEDGWQPEKGLSLLRHQNVGPPSPKTFVFLSLNFLPVGEEDLFVSSGLTSGMVIGPLSSITCF